MTLSNSATQKLDVFDAQCISKEAVLAAVIDIAEEVRARLNPLESNDPSLANGLAGQAVFLAHLSRHHDPQAAYARLAQASLSRMGQLIAESRYLHPGLFSGIVGMSWAAEHAGALLATPSNPADSNEVCEFLEGYLFRPLESRPEEFEYDLMSGLAGLGVWALRLQDAEWRSRLLKRILLLLREAAVAMPEGCAWRTPALRTAQMRLQPLQENEFNLGVAHGTPGVVGFLAECVQRGEFWEISRELLEKSATWLMAQANFSNALGVFPYGAGSNLPTRLAWCYGDIGIALVLLRAARALQSPSLQAFCERLARRVAERTLDNAGVIDTGICHGSGGLVYMMARLAAITNDPALKRAHDYWLRALMASREPDAGIAGFRCWVAEPKSEFAVNGGLLTGAVGVGLVLLSELSDDTRWSYPFVI